MINEAGRNRQDHFWCFTRLPSQFWPPLDVKWHISTGFRTGKFSWWQPADQRYSISDTLTECRGCLFSDTLSQISCRTCLIKLTQLRRWIARLMFRETVVCNSYHNAMQSTWLLFLICTYSGCVTESFSSLFISLPHLVLVCLLTRWKKLIPLPWCFPFWIRIAVQSTVSLRSLFSPFSLPNGSRSVQLDFTYSFQL